MCYPIVKEQDFPARRKELQTNPDYRARKAFCQTLSLGIFGADNRARCGKRKGMRSSENARQSTDRGDRAAARQNCPAGRCRHAAIAGLIREEPGFDTCTKTYKFRNLYEFVQVLEIVQKRTSRQARSGSVRCPILWPSATGVTYLRPKVFRGSQSAWRTPASDLQLVQKRTSS